MDVYCLFHSVTLFRYICPYTQNVDFHTVSSFRSLCTDCVLKHLTCSEVYDCQPNTHTRHVQSTRLHAISWPYRL